MFESYCDIVTDYNVVYDKCQSIDTLEDREIFMLHADLPWPIWDRVYFGVKYEYYNLYDEPNHMMIFSSEGTTKFQDYYKENYAKKTLVGEIDMYGWQALPIKNIWGQVTGTKLIGVQQSDNGGNIPIKLVKSRLPDEALESAQNLIAKFKKHKEEDSDNEDDKEKNEENEENEEKKRPHWFI